VIEELLPAGAACSEAFHDPENAELFPEERELVARAVAKRRAEFTTGRHCARRALAALGVAPQPILAGKHRAPRWPEGYTGTITHCTGYRAAAVASTAVLDSIGVDAEPSLPLPAGVLDRIALPGERAMLARLTEAHPGVCWDRLLFCGKEAVYKAWYPLTGRWLGFEEADITIDAAPDLGSGRFAARILARQGVTGSDGLPVSGFAGRWLARNGLIVTCVAVGSPGWTCEPTGRNPVRPTVT